MKTYEELLSDIEDDIELMGASHIVYSMEENNIITDYDYLPSDSCNISTTLKDLQENIRQQMLYAKVSGHLAAADKTAPKLAVIFPGIGYTADKPLLYYTSRLARKHGYQIQTVSYGTLPENETLSKCGRLLISPSHRQKNPCAISTGPLTAASSLFPKALVLLSLLLMQPNII